MKSVGCVLRHIGAVGGASKRPGGQRASAKKFCSLLVEIRVYRQTSGSETHAKDATKTRHCVTVT